jgi:hypothetical protein
MVEAYVFFHDALKAFFLGTPSEPALYADVALAARLEECFQALRNSLQVVTIDLQPGDDAQVIFETLNARGEPLLPADLLRDYIFLRAARTGQDAESLYEEHWAPFDDPFWREEVKQGRLVRPRSDLFMQHFLASQVSEDVPIKHLFRIDQSGTRNACPSRQIIPPNHSTKGGRSHFPSGALHGVF